MKPIIFSRHAIEQLFYRGVTKDEVIEAISSSTWEPADIGRYQCKRNFAYNNIWNKKYYKIKQVRPIFAEEENQITVITVYTYFFNTE